MAQPAHHPGCFEVVPLHVSDDEGDQVLADRDHVVPVTPDLDTDAGRPVTGGDVPAADGWDGVGQQVPLQLVGDPALAVEGPGPDDDRAHLLGQLLGQPEVSLGEATARPGGDEGDGPEDLLVAQAERHGDVGGEAERLEDGVVAFVPARRPEELVVHLGTPHRLAAPDHLHGRMHASGFGRVRGAQLLGERPLVRVGVPGRHPPHLSVLVRDVDEAQVGHDRHRDLGQTLHHFAVVDDLREHLGGEEEELVAPPRLEELFDQMLTFGGLGRRVQQLAEIVAHGVHELHDGRVALTLVAAEHLHDPHRGAVVADREGVGTLQPVLHERVRDEALILDEVRHPQRLAVFEDPAREAVAAAGRIGRLLPGEGGGDARAARPDVPADQLLVGR